MNNSYKYLFKNIGLLTLSQFGTKFLSFFLTPLYTYILTTSEYGIFDIYSTTVALLIPVLSINISDAVLRFALDKDKDAVSVYLVGVKYTVISIVLFAVLLLGNNLFGLIPIFSEYSFLLFALFSVTTINLLLGNYSRGLGKIKAVAVSGIISSIFVFGLNIIFLVVLKWGLEGYFLAFIFGPLASIAYLYYQLRPQLIFNSRINSPLNKEMLVYASAMLLTAMGWWINNAADRYIVTSICGVAANGIYAIAYKIPSLLKMFQSVFNQAWILSSVKEFESQEKNVFFSRTYGYYSAFVVFACALIIATTKISSRILYSLDFYQAWVFVPFLTISVLFDSLAGYTEGIFLAKKDTKSIGCSVFVGAMGNILFNLLLISAIGIMGAAISSLISCGIVWILRMKWISKHIVLQIKYIRDIFALILLLSESCVLLFVENIFIMYILLIIHILVLVVLYRRELVVIKNVINMKNGASRLKKEKYNLK